MVTPSETFDIVEIKTEKIEHANVSENEANEYLLLANSFASIPVYEKRPHV